MWELAFAFSSWSHLTNSRHGRKREKRNFWQRADFAGTRSNRSLPRTTYNVFRGVIDETKSEGHCELQDKPLPMARVGKRGWSSLVSLPAVSHSRTLPPPAALRQDLNCHHSFPSINHPIARMKCIFHDPAVLKCILLNGEITKHFLAKFLQHNFQTPDPKGSFRHNFLPELKQGGLKLPVI